MTLRSVGANQQSSAWALVPLKSGERAKSRLGAVLNSEQRLRLFYSMAERVIRALQGARGIGSVAVVTASSEVASFARNLGATALVQPADLGVSAALSAALATVQDVRWERVLMLPGDLPLISSVAVEELLSAACGHGIVIVPDRHRIGTNALLCTPPDVITPRFGDQSFDRHLAAAAAAGVPARTLELADLALDLDSRDDLEYLSARADASTEALFDILRASDPCRVVVG